MIRKFMILVFIYVGIFQIILYANSNNVSWEELKNLIREANRYDREMLNNVIKRGKKLSKIDYEFSKKHWEKVLIYIKRLTINQLFNICRTVSKDIFTRRDLNEKWEFEYAGISNIHFCLYHYYKKIKDSSEIEYFIKSVKDKKEPYIFRAALILWWDNIICSKDENVFLKYTNEHFKDMLELFLQVLSESNNEELVRKSAMETAIDILIIKHEEIINSHKLVYEKFLKIIERICNRENISDKFLRSLRSRLKMIYKLEKNVIFKKKLEDLFNKIDILLNQKGTSKNYQFLKKNSKIKKTVKIFFKKLKKILLSCVCFSFIL